MDKDKMTEEEKIKYDKIRKICGEINEISFFDSIYNPDNKYSTEQTNLEMLGQLTAAIKALYKFIEYYDCSELLNQHRDISLEDFEKAVYDLEEKRQRLFGDSLNWKRIVEVGFQNLSKVEELNKELEAIKGSEEKL